MLGAAWVVKPIEMLVEMRCSRLSFDGAFVVQVSFVDTHLSFTRVCELAVFATDAVDHIVFRATGGFAENWDKFVVGRGDIDYEAAVRNEGTGEAMAAQGRVLLLAKHEAIGVALEFRRRGAMLQDFYLANLGPKIGHLVIGHLI